MNIIWSAIDYDAPQLFENGCVEVWRKPIFHPAVAVAILHALDWPCRWRAIPDYDELHHEAYQVDWARWHLIDIDALERAALDALLWEASNPDLLRTVAPWDVPRLRGWSRAIDRLLPPAGPKPPKGRRCFGSRRGPKRWRPRPG